MNYQPWSVNTKDSQEMYLFRTKPSLKYLEYLALQNTDDAGDDAYKSDDYSYDSVSDSYDDIYE